MPNATTLADVDLQESYNNSIGKFFDTGGGKVITSFMGIAAVILLFLLLAALVMKAMGRQNKLVQQFAPGAGRIVAILLAIFLLAGPSVTFPALLSVSSKLINGLGTTTTDILGS